MVVGPGDQWAERLILLHTHHIGPFFDISLEGTIVYVRYNPSKPELW
jgi:hypothetical protein